MANRFTLTGGWTVEAASGSNSFDPAFATTINEVRTLDYRQVTVQDLLDNAEVTITFGAVTEAHVLIVDASAKVTMKLTSADGTAQVVAADKLILLCADSPVTALKVTRSPGVDTTLRIFAGQAA